MMAEIELREIPLFSEMDEQEVAGIRAIMEEIKFKPGQVIIREGEIGDLFYVIMEGHAEVIIRDAAGADIVLHKAGPGDFFGELSMLTNEPRSARVRATENLTTLALEREQFFNFLRTHTHAAIDVMVELGGRLRENDILVRSMVSRNVNEVEEERLTIGQRVADSVADTIGSWPFIIIQSILLTIWILLNISAWINHWDPYPFILLNLMLSFQAAYAGPVIMMSQNRQSAKDRLVAEIDHQVNTKAELEINNLIRRMDELELSLEHNHSELKGFISKRQKEIKPKAHTSPPTRSASGTLRSGGQSQGRSVRKNSRKTS
jgi:CRP/FNR family transcriptional regulator, cyclic AMP receptor protein